MVDLHVHSACSDGTFTPEELVDYAMEKGLRAFALTDHDTVNGLDRAIRYAEGLRQTQEASPADAPAPQVPEVIPGIELSTEYQGKDIHMVGLFIDYHQPDFAHYLEDFIHSRENRNKKMCALLREHGIDITYEALLAEFPGAVITRAHFARYLLSHGYIQSMKEAFDRYVGDHCPCFVPREKVTPAQAVELILGAGGVLGRLADCTGSGRDCAEALMAELGAADIAALETVPYAALAAAYNKVAPALKAAGKNTGCAPHPNAFYLGDPLENAFRPETARIPLLVGTVFGEFAAFNGFGLNKAQMSAAEAEGFAEKMLGKQTADALLPLFHAAYPERSAADLPFLDVLFREPTMRYIRRRAETGPVWSYFFNQDFTIEGGRAPWHCSDIPFVFHNTELVPSANISGVTPQLEQQIFDAVLAFARTGNPQHSGIPTWPASTPQQENTMLFDSATRLAPNHDKALIAAALPAISALMARNFDPDSIQH